MHDGKVHSPNLPTNITSANIARLKFSGRSPMGLGIPPLMINIMLESNPLKSTMLVRKLAVLSFIVVLLICNVLLFLLF